MHKSPDCLYIAGIHRLCVQAWIKGFHGWQKSKQQLYPARFRWCWVSNMLIACVKLCMQMPANIKIVVFLSSNMTETLASTWYRTQHLCFVLFFVSKDWICVCNRLLCVLILRFPPAYASQRGVHALPLVDTMQQSWASTREEAPQWLRHHRALNEAGKAKATVISDMNQPAHRKRKKKNNPRADTQPEWSHKADHDASFRHRALT